MRLTRRKSKPPNRKLPGTGISVHGDPAERTASTSPRSAALLAAGPAAKCRLLGPPGGRRSAAKCGEVLDLLKVGDMRIALAFNYFSYKTLVDELVDCRPQSLARRTELGCALVEVRPAAHAAKC